MEASVTLCDGCGSAWCEECLTVRMGSGYMAKLGALEEDAQWHCPYCDTRLWEQFTEGARVPPTVQLAVGLRVLADWQGLGTLHGGMVMAVGPADEETAAPGGAADQAAGCEVASIMYDDSYWEERVPSCLVRTADDGTPPVAIAEPLALRPRASGGGEEDVARKLNVVEAARVARAIFERLEVARSGDASVRLGRLVEQQVAVTHRYLRFPFGELRVTSAQPSLGSERDRSRPHFTP